MKNFMKYILVIAFVFSSISAEEFRKKKKVLTIGGATQDIFLDHKGSDYITIAKHGSSVNYLLFESGEKVEVPHLEHLTGGGATNTAVSFSRLGLDTACFCVIQNDRAGLAVLNKLQDENVDTRFVTTIRDHATGVSFIVKSSLGERTVFVHRGANAFLKKEDIPRGAIKTSDYLYMTSMSSDSAKLFPIITKYAAKHSVPVAVNPGSTQVSKGADVFCEGLKYVDILIMNSYEAKLLMAALSARDDSLKKTLESTDFICKTGRKCRDDSAYMINTMVPYENHFFNVRKFFQETLKMGPRIVIITNGSNGVYLATEDKIYFHPSLNVDVFDSVGAGDAFGSCFVGSLLLGYSIKDALKNGITNSASVLQKLGAKAGLLTHNQIKEQVKKIDKDLFQEFDLYN